MDILFILAYLHVYLTDRDHKFIIFRSFIEIIAK